jgi:hypothetical protein
VGRSRRLRFVVLVSAFATVSALFALLPAVARAATNDLGPIGFGAVAVDDVRGHVFVSGPTANVVEVLDFSGNLVATIPNLPGAWGMLVSGRYLYVAETSGGAIVRIDLTSPTFTATPFATGLLRPLWVVMAGGKLWTTVSVSLDSSYSTLASIDPKSGRVKDFSQTYFSPLLATTPGAPNTLFLAQSYLSPGSVFRIDVSAAKPRVVISNTFTNQSSIVDLVVSPDGTRVIPASGSPYYFEELSASTLQPDGTIYPGAPYPSAVAVSPGRSGLLATGLDGGYSSPDIAVYPLGATSPVFTATTYNSSGTANVRPQGLALSADGSTLFAVTSSDVYSTNTIFNTFSLP